MQGRNVACSGRRLGRSACDQQESMDGALWKYHEVNSPSRREPADASGLYKTRDLSGRKDHSRRLCSVASLVSPSRSQENQVALRGDICLKISLSLYKETC